MRGHSLVIEWRKFSDKGDSKYLKFNVPARLSRWRLSLKTVTDPLPGIVGHQAVIR
jgi:hypothetical protein